MPIDSGYRAFYGLCHPKSRQNIQFNRLKFYFRAFQFTRHWDVADIIFPWAGPAPNPFHRGSMTRIFCWVLNIRFLSIPDTANGFSELGGIGYLCSNSHTILWNYVCMPYLPSILPCRYGNVFVLYLIRQIRQNS